jgi:dihydrofolate reductase
MSSVRCHISISLDGFVAGLNQSPADPIGEGGLRLHEWAFATRSWRAQQGLEGGDQGADSEVVDRAVSGVGAYVMGRKMFGGGPGPWDESWRGWWGESPPFHAPVFVLTHREVLTMRGGTSFTLVGDGIESALELHVVPVCLGAGERLLEHVGDPVLAPVRVIASPTVTHISYRVGRPNRTSDDSASA